MAGYDGSEGESPCSRNNSEGCEKCRRGCFPYSALIETPSGKIPIGDLRVGQMVLSYSNTGILVPRRITRKLSYGPASIVRVEFTPNKTHLNCTESHSFLTGRGWLAVKKLHSGDSIFQAKTSRISPIQIRRITSTGKMEPVFNLYTEGEHNFIADDCIAHNFTFLRVFRMALHRIFFDNSSKIMFGQLTGQN